MGTSWDRLDQRMKDRLTALIKASGGRVWFGEGYRSAETQRALFLSRYARGPGDSQVTWNGEVWHKIRKGDLVAAPPGASMHELGLAADLRGDLAWVDKHAAEFGLKTFAHVNNDPPHVQLLELPNGRREYEKSGGGTSSGSGSSSGSSSSGAAWPDNSGRWKQAQQAVFSTWLRQQPEAQQQQIIDWLKADYPLAEVARYINDSNTPSDVRGYITDFLSQLSKDEQRAMVGQLAVGTRTPAPANNAQPSQELIDLLAGMGVHYGGNAQPTPALLAFLNGIGLNMSSAEDLKRRAIERIGAASSDAMSDIDRTAGRTKQNITADLVRRGVLSSGESNTRYAQQAEDVGAQQRDVQRTKTNAIEDAETGLSDAQARAKQAALERVVNEEENQATSSAVARQQEEARRAQQEANDLNYARSRAAQEDALRQQLDLIKRYADQGVVV